jgi:hypothetical protein
MTETKRRSKIDIIYDLTGLNYCDEDCGCGENAQLWYLPPGQYGVGIADWVPEWMNGVSTDEIWEWLVQNKKIPK